MPVPEPIADDDILIPLQPHRPGQVVLRRETFRWQFARSGGPGGQNVNKLSTKALLRWHPQQADLPADILHRLLRLARTYLTGDGELLIISQRHRTQRANQDDCIEKLVQLIVAAIPAPKIRRATKPSRGAKERRLQTKRHASQRRDRRKIQRED